MGEGCTLPNETSLELPELNFEERNFQSIQRDAVKKRTLHSLWQNQLSVEFFRPEIENERSTI